MVTRQGILILEKVQELNEYSPMLSTLSDSLMDEIFAYGKARLPISVTVAGVPIRASVMECTFPDYSIVKQYREGQVKRTRGGSAKYMKHKVTIHKPFHHALVHSRPM